jgi:predicted AAA+ superfamily ATPase
VIGSLIENFHSYLSNNDFASAGFVIGFLGVLVSYARKIPQYINKWSFRSIEIRDDIEYFDIIKKFLSTQEIYFSRHSIFYGQKKSRRVFGTEDELTESDDIVDETGLIFYRKKIVLFSINRNNEHKNEKSFNESITLRFLFTSKNKMNEIINEIIEKNKENKDVVSVFSSSSSYWDFHSRREKILIPPILPNDELNNIVDDVKHFFESENFYKSRNIPYHRGYLLHGIPGSGKSSLVQYISYKFSCNINIIRTKDSLSDQNFPELIEKLPKDSILLIEDMDRLFEGKKKDIVDVSNLLNCIDGVLSPPHRFLLFITANNKKLIPDALIRPGRIDYELEFKYATLEQVIELSCLFFPKIDKKRIHKYCHDLASQKVSMTYVREKLMRIKNIDELYE